MRQLFAALLGLVLLLGASAVSADEPRVSRFGEYSGYSPQVADGYVRTSFYLPMRDGVRLAVDLYRPTKGGVLVEGRFPVIWHHTNDRGPGGPIPERANPGLAAMPLLTRYGYVVAVVERRGLGASTGARRGYHDRNEDFDAYEVTEWLAAQAWSTGNVGIWGCSNTGEAAMHAVSVAPPHLKAAFAGCFSFNKYDGMLRGGIFAQWGTGPERTFDQDMTARPVDGDESRTLLRIAATDHRNSTVLYDLWTGMPYRDSFSPLVGSRFWAEGSLSSYLPQVRASGVPIYILGGWQDEFRKEGMVAFANLDPGKRRIIIGPWRHCMNDGFNLLAEAHRFFDYYLKGIDNGLAAEDPVHYFTIGAPAGQEWQSAPDLPLNFTRRPFYLAPAGLSPRAPGARDKDAATAFTISYDVPAPGPNDPPDRRLNGIMAFAVPAPTEAAGTHFLGPVLGADTEVTGIPIADLWITATSDDAALFVYLEDVAPDGTVRVVTDGRLRASHRRLNDPPYAYLGLPWHRSYAEDVEALVPGQAARLTFDLFPISWVFKAGHRMRISIAGADYRERNRPQLTPPPTVRILNSPDHPSTVGIPVVG